MMYYFHTSVNEQSNISKFIVKLDDLPAVLVVNISYTFKTLFNRTAALFVLTFIQNKTMMLHVTLTFAIVDRDVIFVH